MNKINQLFCSGELNKWLYWKIDALFIEDYPRINKFQKNFKYWTALFVVIYSWLSVWIHAPVCNADYDHHIPLWWPVMLVMIPACTYLFLGYFRRVRFMYYYKSLRDALSIDYFGFDHFLRRVDCDLKHVVYDHDGYMHCNLARQLKNGLLSVETKFADRAQETSEWLRHRDRFSKSFKILKRFHLIAKPEEGWTPYMRKAKGPPFQ